MTPRGWHRGCDSRFPAPSGPGRDLWPCHAEAGVGRIEGVAMLVVASGLVKAFRADGVERPVLRGVSLSVDDGEWVAVMGPSGCGKSTMLHLLGGLDLPDEGSILHRR